MEMTESEICRLYRHAKDRGEQVQILAELNRTKRAEIIAILLRNGEKGTSHNSDQRKAKKAGNDGRGIFQSPV